jgi:hypothetical protein
MTTTSPPATRLDHLVLVAPTLHAGAAWARAVLGADLRPGGWHDRMGTHNLLLGLGANAYLEVIAIDPAAPPPGRARWFGLDNLATDAEPPLAAWVARTDDVDAAAAASPEPLGAVEPMSRGALKWRLTVPPDGSLPLGGAGPLLIQWEAGAHPAAQLPDDGCELVGLTITHPDPERVGRLLAAIGFAGPVAVVGGEAVKLTAEIRTQSGVRRL